MKTFLNTAETLFLDEAGQMFRDGFPRLIVGGHETVEIQLVKGSPSYGTEEAAPGTWEVDSSWSEIEGISAMLTIDNDYIHRIAGNLSSSAAAGVTSVSATITGAGAGAEDIPLTGTLRIYSADGNYEDVSYTSRKISGSAATFTLGTKLVNDYEKGASIDCKQSPLASSFLDASSSDWSKGKLVFDLAVDSLRLRQETEYSNSATIAIPGMELLLYQTTSDNITRKIKAFLWDSVSLWKTQGDPGVSAPIPDEQKNEIAAEINRSLAEVTKNPLEFQFSVDGTTEWHTVQTTEDNYYRQRISGINSEWSPAIMLVRGAQGADGADGVDGYTPVKGTDYWTEADKQEIKDYVDSAILNGEW